MGNKEMPNKVDPTFQELVDEDPEETLRNAINRIKTPEGVRRFAADYINWANREGGEETTEAIARQNMRIFAGHADEQTRTLWLENVSKESEQ